jgi:hypothetical protein
MPKRDVFAATVQAARKAADGKAIAAALGALVKAKVRKPAPPRQSFASRVHNAQAALPTIGKRRSARRLGKFQRYTPTSKPDYSRPGTFRTYMIATIRAHTDTHSANQAHALCDTPAFAKNRLDFNWAADNGYITFD